MGPILVRVGGNTSAKNSLVSQEYIPTTDLLSSGKDTEILPLCSDRSLFGTSKEKTKKRPSTSREGHSQETVQRRIIMQKQVENKTSKLTNQQ